MNPKTILSISVLMLFFVSRSLAQDTTDIMKQLEKEMGKSEKEQTLYTTATFKTTRLINGHSVENTGKRVMDVKISHRFEKLNEGFYNLFGLDEARMRFGFDYGLTDNLMVGIGRSTYQKTYDVFLKFRILRQSRGKKNMPFTLSYVPTFAIRTLKVYTVGISNDFASSASYTHQLIIGRKFSDNTSLQIMPTYVHRHLITLNTDPDDVFAIGIGGRQKLTKRISLNAEYYYQVTRHQSAGTNNLLSIGFDLETGGHVFQLHFTNSQAMNESNFISGTNGNWGKGDILFGFNISRVFTLGKKH